MIIQLLLAVMFAPPVSAGAAEAARMPEISSAVVSSANRRFSARCAQQPLGVDALLADKAQRADLETCPLDEGRDLLEYAACRNLQGAPGGCSALEGLSGGFRGAAAHCVSIVAEDRLVYATLSGGDALSACRAVLKIDGRSGPSVEKECPLMIGLVRSEGPKLSCESLKRAKIVAAEDSCDDTRIFWSGAPQDCDRYSNDAGARRFCRERAALVAGLRDPALCAASPFCQALTTKSPAACEPLRVRFSRTLCTRVAASMAKERPVSVIAKEKTEKVTAAAVAAAAAAVAANKAKVEAAAVKAKAEALANQEKVAKLSAASAAKTAAAAALVRSKAEAEAKKEAKAKAEIAKKDKPQFKKGVPMQAVPIEAKEIMKALEEGRPVPTAKPKPKKIPTEEGEPAGQ